jgi:hypothetical protein
MVRLTSVLLLFTPLALGQAEVALQNPAFQQRADTGPDLEGLAHSVQRLLENIQGLQDWDAEYHSFMGALERMYEKNGWNSEPDRFSLELSRDVEAYPPWAVHQRLDAFVNILSERYFLDESQEQVLRQLFVEESSGLFQRNIGRIMSYAPEIIQTRAAGAPFTPEQVARWSQRAGPVLQDLRQTFGRAAQRFEHSLDEQQRDLLRTDMEAGERRITGVLRDLNERWAKGDWDAADWGMDDDPIQLGMRQRDAGAPTDASEPATATRDGSAAASTSDGDGAAATDRNAPPASATDAPPARGASGDRPDARRARADAGPVLAAPDDPWAPYVREFIARYRLKQGQQEAAWRIHRSAAERRDQLLHRYQQRNGEPGSASPSSASPDSPGAARNPQLVLTPEQADSVARVFDQLRSRLERLPTRAQRAAAEHPAPASGSPR